MFAAGAHIGWADECESALQLTHFDQTHTDTSTPAIAAIIDQLNLHQLTRTRGRSAACFRGFRSGARARRAMHMAWAHMEKDPEPAVDAIATWFSTMLDNVDALTP